jgi:hypothetical protein
MLQHMLACIGFSVYYCGVIYGGAEWPLQLGQSYETNLAATCKVDYALHLLCFRQVLGGARMLACARARSLSCSFISY